MKVQDEGGIFFLTVIADAALRAAPSTRRVKRRKWCIAELFRWVRGSKL